MGVELQIAWYEARAAAGGLDDDTAAMCRGRGHPVAAIIGRAASGHTVAPARRGRRDEPALDAAPDGTPLAGAGGESARVPVDAMRGAGCGAPSIPLPGASAAPAPGESAAPEGRLQPRLKRSAQVDAAF